MAKKSSYMLRAKLWLYPGETANWHFLSVSKKEAARIKKDFGANARGWGSLPVFVSIGTTEWTTSIFPDKRSGSYLLPVKASVRKAEELSVDDEVRFRIIITPNAQR